MTSEIQESIRAEAAAERQAMEVDAALYAIADTHEKEAKAKKNAWRARIEPFMQLNDLDELIDGETGKGVKIEPPQSTTEWDTRHLTDAEALFLRDNGLLTINTRAFDATRKNAGAIELDEIDTRLRMTGEKSPAFKAIQGD